MRNSGKGMPDSFSYSARVNRFDCGLPVTALPLAESLFGEEQPCRSKATEISKRQGRSISEILSEAGSKHILEDHGLNPAAKTSELMKIVNRLFHPELTRAKEEFYKRIAGLGLPDNVKLEPSRSFEKDSQHMTIEFRNAEELAGKWPRLKEILLENTG